MLVLLPHTQVHLLVVRARCPARGSSNGCHRTNTRCSRSGGWPNTGREGSCGVRAAWDRRGWLDCAFGAQSMQCGDGHRGVGPAPCAGRRARAPAWYRHRHARAAASTGRTGSTSESGPCGVGRASRRSAAAATAAQAAGAACHAEAGRLRFGLHAVAAGALPALEWLALQGLQRRSRGHKPRRGAPLSRQAAPLPSSLAPTANAARSPAHIAAWHQRSLWEAPSPGPTRLTPPCLTPQRVDAPPPFWLG